MRKFFNYKKLLSFLTLSLVILFSVIVIGTLVSKKLVKTNWKNVNYANADEFVNKYLKDIRSISYVVNDKPRTLQVFEVAYGEPMDCPAGCIYDQAVGIIHKGKAGFVYPLPPKESPLNNFPLYDFDKNDEYLYDIEFVKSLIYNIKGYFYDAYLGLLVRDKDIPYEVVQSICLGKYYEHIPAQELLDNSRVQKDRVCLSEISNNFSGHTAEYTQEIQQKARFYLDRLGTD